MDVFNKLNEKIGVFSKLLSYAGALVLFALMLLTTMDVAGRYLFNTPLMGVFEITEFMMVCLVFCSLAYTQSKKAHVAVDILIGQMSKKKQRMIDILNYGISVIILALITWKSIERGFEIMASNESSGTLQIPVYPFLFVVGLGSAALCIEFFKDMINRIRGHGES